MQYKTEQIRSIVQGHWAQNKAFDITEIATDSRQIRKPVRTIFVALRGNRTDGHIYIPAAYQLGVRVFIVDRPIDTRPFPEAAIILVPDSLTAIQALASFHRSQFKLPVLGITGSNGKTIVKEWLSLILAPYQKIAKSPRSFNSQLGVPLSVLQLNKEHQLAIFEAGISQVGEMQTLQKIIRCELGIFTNLGSAHAAGFKSATEKLLEKFKLFESTEMILYCKDQLIVDQYIQELGLPGCSWSIQGNPADFQIKVLHQNKTQTILRAWYQGKKQEVSLPFSDTISVENAIHCWCFLWTQNIPAAYIRKGLLQLSSIPMRMEILAGSGNSLIINDTYNNDSSGLKYALTYLQTHASTRQKALILSDILQSDLDTAGLYQHIGQLIQIHEVDLFIGIGTSIQRIKPFLSNKIQSYFYTDTTNLLDTFPWSKLQHKAILLKGARTFAFEQIAQFLSHKLHETVLEVNLSNLEHNLMQYYRQLDGDTKIMAMIKADAYGCGSIEVARLLAFHQTDFLAVAYLDEALELRRAGIGSPMIVLSPGLQHLDELLAFDLQAEISNFNQLESFGAFLKDTKQALGVHLNLDTGMHRRGFSIEELPNLMQSLQRYPELKIRSVFSHLVASEQEQEDAFTREQFQLFQKMCTQLERILPRPFLRHILNSSGIPRFPQYHLDMVRLGIGLYGIDPSGLLVEALRPVYALKSIISQIKVLKAGESIGYGRAYMLKSTRRVGTLNIGYADGLPRLAGNAKVSFQIKGENSPVIGNICMDMCMIDLTDIPEAQVGDTVVLFQDQQSIQSLANAAQTIPYEILTNISKRVKRIYIQD